MEVPTLDESVARQFVVHYGLAEEPDILRIDPVGGGVSSRVFRAETRREAFILKQPMECFQVADDWRVDRRRCFVEHAFSRAVGPLLPSGSTPRVVVFAPQFLLLVFEAAPSDWRPWKQDLLAGKLEPRIADDSACLLANIHEVGERASVHGRFDNDALFVQQRIDPYFETTGRRVPEATNVLRGLHAFFRKRCDLVHGDFSPKNLLTNGERIRLVDHEVVTRGDAAFDVAFFLTHLVLKSIHHASKRPEFLDAGTRFVRVYAHARQAQDPDAESRAMRYLGPLLLARVWGKSPVEYLGPKARGRATRLGLGWTQDPPGSWSEACEGAVR